MTQVPFLDKRRMAPNKRKANLFVSRHVTSIGVSEIQLNLKILRFAKETEEMIYYMIRGKNLTDFLRCVKHGSYAQFP